MNGASVSEGAEALLERMAWYEFEVNKRLAQGNVEGATYWMRLWRAANNNTEKPVGWIE